MTKKDLYWGAFGIFTGIAINMIARSMSPDMIKGLVIGIIFGGIGGLYISDKLFNKTKDGAEAPKTEAEEGEEESR